MTDIRSSLFGRLALDTELITLEQMQECLNLQVEYEKADKKIPRLGELMAAKGYLTADQVRTLLRKQREASPPQGEVGPDPVATASSEEEECSDDPGTSQRRAGGQAFGKFTILKRLGADASGYTYKAKYTPRDLTVILRVLSQGKMQENPAYVSAFEEKVKKATELNHPGIQRVVAAGRIHGRDYYAAQFIEGISLKRILEARNKIDAPFALRIAIQAAEAIEYGHARGVYHQEIRPSNILILPDKTSMLVAFGVAHDVIGNLERIALTSGETNFYVAPEQAIKEERGGHCDARTDIYCLGAVLYHALTGQPPFKGESVSEVLLSLAEEDVVDPTLLNPEITPELANLILGMMNPEPDMRYQNATQLLIDLRAVENDLLTAEDPSPVAKSGAARIAKKKPVPSSVMARSKPVMGGASRAKGPQGGRGAHNARRHGNDNDEDRKPGRSRQKPEDNTGLIMAIAGVAVMVVAVIAIIIVLSGDDKKTKSKTNSNQPGKNGTAVANKTSPANGAKGDSKAAAQATPKKAAAAATPAKKAPAGATTPDPKAAKPAAPKAAAAPAQPVPPAFPAPEKDAAAPTPPPKKSTDKAADDLDLGDPQFKPPKRSLFGL